EPGEILVVPFTTPAYNVVLPLAGGIVTAQGGPLSHAAVLARELDLPAVIGATGALALVNGVTITIDPESGQVTVHPETAVLSLSTAGVLPSPSQGGEQGEAKP
ncbi:MAG TPA: PEP-utilizing enzyme, partial [Ilumatobacteraceae bacterium]|nr:PEP-utilizing enzyme [Ilumatobacteraceae bacterium]